MIIVLGMQKFLRRNWKQTSEAVNDYLNGVDVSARNVNKTIAWMDTQMKNGVQGDALNAAIRSASRDVQEGSVLGNVAGDISGARNRSEMMAQVQKMTDKNGMVHLTGISNVANIRSARGFSTTSDLQAAGAIAATGVIGFSAVAGAANLIDGD